MKRKLVIIISVIMGLLTMIIVLLVKNAKNDNKIISTNETYSNSNSEYTTENNDESVSNENINSKSNTTVSQDSKNKENQNNVIENENKINARKSK